MPDLTDFIDDELVERVKAALRRKRAYEVETLADQLDVSPKRVRDAVDKLRLLGFRIPDERAGTVELVKVPPTRSDEIHKLPLELLAGDRIRFGVVSDTHLSSKEQALEELELAYDYFEREEIADVLHAGDFTAGVGIFPGQHNSILNHTYEDQVDYLVERYPKRAGIVTRGIGGNHDLEGQFGRIGADPVKALANRRDDIQYLGPFSAWVELPNGALIHLLHGKGGMSYAYSYKAQKLTEGYAAGRKPHALIVGHWHVQGCLQSRGIQVMFPACFEWRSVFLERIGLSPAVGFHVVEALLGDDGSIVEWLPRWKPFWEGRVVTQPLAA